MTHPLRPGSISNGLCDVSDADLSTLAGLLQRGELRSPFSTTGLQSRGLGHVATLLEPFLALDGPGLRAVVDAVLAERTHRKGPRLTLVWTGDDPGIGHSRHTRVVLPELFEQARKHVLIAGYSFDHGGDLFPALYRAMRDRDVTADFFVDVRQLVERLRDAARAEGRDWGLLSAPLEASPNPEARGTAAVGLFFELMWPFGDPRPRVFFDPRTAASMNAISLHAKCVVIDHHLTLITSANFTDRGQTRNFEAGVTIEDRAFAATLERQWANLVEAGVVVAATNDRYG